MGAVTSVGDVPLNLVNEYHQKWKEARQRMVSAAVKQKAPEPKLRLFVHIEPKKEVEERVPRLPPIADPQLKDDLTAVLIRHEATWALVVNHSRLQPTHAVRREIYGYLYRRGWSLSKIGRFCNRDHTSILHALRRGGYVERR